MNDEDTSAGPPDAAEAELNYERVCATYLTTLTELFETKPERFMNLICHAVLGRDFEGIEAAKLPSIGFRDAIRDVSVDSDRQRYAYLADLLLRKHRGDLALPKTEFITLAQFVEHDARLDVDFYPRVVRSIRATDIWRDFFRRFESDLALSLALATSNVYQGVPLYRCNPSTLQFGLVDRGEPLFHYLFYRGRAFDDPLITKLPGWTHELYFKQEDLRWHGVFFASLEHNDPQELQRLRTAFLKHLGMPPLEDDLTLSSSSKWPWGNHDTTLLGHLAEAAKRFWTNYDPADIGTAPTSQDVVEWLVARGVAQRNAEIMATILRADGLPTGPRR